MLTKEQIDELVYVLNQQRERYCDALGKASDKTQPVFLERIAVIDSLITWAMTHWKEDTNGSL